MILERGGVPRVAGHLGLGFMCRLCVNITTYLDLILYGWFNALSLSSLTNKAPSIVFL